MPGNTERVSGLDPGSSFYRQLQKLLSPNSKPSYQFLPFAIAPRVTSPSPTFDLQHVADSSTPETDVSSSIETDTTECISSSDLLQTLYIPHGKWEWARDHSIVDEQSRFLSSGAMCSTFFKIGRLATREVKYICKSWQTSMHWENAFYSELALYKKQLKPLQGKCVPHIINVYTGPAALNVAMEPPHSSFWIEASADMPLSLKKLCVDAFTEIHARGVFHGDIELRHMLIGGDAKVTIIDFQESAALEPNEKVHLKLATAADLRKEMRKVKVKLDYPGARAYEEEKRNRSFHGFLQAQLDSPCAEQETEEDVLDPPILDQQEWDDWIAAPKAPRLFVVPNQSLHQRTTAYEAFLASLKGLPQLPANSVSAHCNKRPDGGPSSSRIVQEKRETRMYSVAPSDGPTPSMLGLGERSRTTFRKMQYKVLENAFPLPPAPTDTVPSLRNLVEQSKPNLVHHSPDNSFLPKPSESLLDLDHSVLGSKILDRLALLRRLAAFPPQTPGDPLPSQLRHLFHAEYTKVQTLQNTLKRPASAQSHSNDVDRPAKRIRLDSDTPASLVLSGSSNSLSVVPNSSSTAVDTSRPSEAEQSSTCLHRPSSSSSPSSEKEFVGLGKYEWMPNLRYPSAPKTQNEEDGKAWARIAMESLAQCASEQLPHPDLIKLYPHHPRWTEPDVKVFLERLKKSETELAWTAMRYPDTKFTVPRHPRSLGNLKRTLEEIQRDLDDSSAEDSIRAHKRLRCQSTEEDDRGSATDDLANVKRRQSPPATTRKVRFATLDRDEESSSAMKCAAALPLSPASSETSIKISHTTEEMPQNEHSLGSAPSWIQWPLNLVTRVFSWV
ncbi:hypothetical protein GYMLUDRAFT_33352 [Collybiopsis luxurians FD-317 M1]|nr:hypothetical protein GYMLUDRAFT_33352 [Collybiopsis luxurians FD-317 M1]